MKRVKFVLILTLVVLMASTVACKAAEPVAIEPDTTEASAATAEPTEEPTEEPTAEPTEEPKKFQRGVWADSVYNNEYLNLHFTMPEGFVAATDAEIAAMMNLGTEALENDNINEFQAKLAMLTTIYDMMVSNPETGGNVIVMLENLNLSIGAGNLTPEEYATMLATELANTEVSGYKYTVQEGYTAELGGESYYVLPTVLGDGLMLQEYFLRRADGYMLAICITSVGGNDAEAALLKDAFATIDM